MAISESAMWLCFVVAILCESTLGSGLTQSVHTPDPSVVQTFRINIFMKVRLEIKALKKIPFCNMCLLLWP